MNELCFRFVHFEFEIKIRIPTVNYNEFTCESTKSCFDGKMF